MCCAMLCSMGQGCEIEFRTTTVCFLFVAMLCLRSTRQRVYLASTTLIQRGRSSRLEDEEKKLKRKRLRFPFGMFFRTITLKERVLRLMDVVVPLRRSSITTTSMAVRYVTKIMCGLWYVSLPEPRKCSLPGVINVKSARLSGKIRTVRLSDIEDRQMDRQTDEERA